MAVASLTADPGRKPGRNLGVIGPTVSQPSPPPTDALDRSAAARPRHAPARDSEAEAHQTPGRRLQAGCGGGRAGGHDAGHPGADPGRGHLPDAGRGRPGHPLPAPDAHHAAADADTEADAAPAAGDQWRGNRQPAGGHGPDSHTAPGEDDPGDPPPIPTTITLPNAASSGSSGSPPATP